MFKIARKLKETTSHLDGFFVYVKYSVKININSSFIEKIKSYIKCESLRYRLYDGKEPLSKYQVTINQSTGYIDGPQGSKVTRYGYWEYKGRCTGSKNKNWKQIYHENVTALREINPTLPDRVFLLEKPCGSKVYVIGTMHYSEKSVEDVLNVMNKTLPDCVILELCRFRSYSLLKSRGNMKWIEYALHNNIKEIGFLNIFILHLLSQLFRRIKEKNKMHVSGEFKTAFDKANELPCCHVILGDRDFDITIKRALGPLSFGERIKIILGLLCCFPLTNLEIDFKKLEKIEEVNDEMKLKMPSIYRAIVTERDLYLTRSIWDSVMPIDREGKIPSINVAIVGIGHFPGIKKNWKCAANIDLLQLIK